MTFLRPLAVLLALILGGCAVEVAVTPGLDPPPAAGRLPFAVGVHYTEALRGYVHDNSDGDPLFGEPAWTVALGPPSVRLFDLVFAALFVRVVAADGPALARPADAGLDGAVEATIERFAADCDSGTHCRAAIDYGFRFVSGEGRRTASWTVSGRSTVQVITDPKDLLRGEMYLGSMVYTEKLGAAVTRAMEDAAARFVAGFHRHPDVERWADAMTLAE